VQEAETADPHIVDSIMRVAADLKGIAHANGIFAVHFASQQILVALSQEFADELRTPSMV
jgi:hypothetical protein